MARLPSHHVRRPRLTERCRDERVVVVEASGGYGKSVLAAELADSWRGVEIDVRLHEGGVTAEVLVARLRAATERAGYHQAAQAMAGGIDDSPGAVDEVLSALAAERCVFVVDDVHHADREAAALVARMASGLDGEQRMIVLGRRLPPGAARLRRAEYLQLSSTDLALDSDETASVCRSFGLGVDHAAAEAIHRATGGWTAATVLAAARAARTGEDVQEVAEAAQAPAGASHVIGALLEEVLTDLEGAGTTTAQLGRLPLLGPGVVDAATGVPGFFDRALAAGLPLVRSGDTWWDLPGPVRDHLASLAAPDPTVLRRAAEHYVAAGVLGPALELLVAAGEPEMAAEVLAGAPLAAIDALDLSELQAVVDLLPPAAIDAHPMVLIHLAMAYDRWAYIDRRAEALDRAARLAKKADDPALTRALAAERASDLVRDGRQGEAETAALAVIDQASGTEWLTRARALSSAGRAICWRTDGEGRRDLDALRAAAGYLERADRIFAQLDMRTARAGLVPHRAMWIDFVRGNLTGALERLDEGLTLVVDNPRKWAYLMIFKSEVTNEMGRHEESRAVIGEVMRLGRQLDDDQLQAYAHWQEAVIASHQGDAARTLEETRLVEQHKSGWWAAGSPDFFADSADSLDRVGHSALAWEYLAAAQAHPGDAEALITMAHGALLARHGDPEQAEEVLAAAPSHQVDPREYWRVTLLRAYAAFRRGEPEAGALAARAFEQAARMGAEHLPLTKERALTEELVALAVETGQPAALAVVAGAAPMSLSLLGRFELTRGGRQVALTAGQASQLVKFVAVCGGRVATERATDVLWPEADLEAGRNRLRTVLNRLRSEAGEVLRRDGESLALHPDIRVDLALFEAEARRALALGPGEPTQAVAVARSAIARYRGDLLPDDLYAEWAEPPRQHARRRMLELLDLCADVAVRRGDLDEARRVVELTIDLAPYDEDRYLKAAVALLEQGRRGAALTVVARARSALAELGLEPPLNLVRLERSIVA